MIIIDGIIFSLQKSGGISVYFYELLQRIIKHEESVKSIIYRNDNIYTPLINLKENAQIRTHLSLERFRRVNVLGEVGDIFHSSYYRLPGGGYHGKIITTVHDFTEELYPRGVVSYIHHKQKRQAILNSDGIICISENTKKDMHKFIPESINIPTKVIYNGVGNFQCNDKIGTHESYVIFVGARSGYKNFEMCVTALHKLEDINLVVVGGGPFSDLEKSLLNSNIPGRYKHVGFVSEAELNVLYQNALALVYPSYYEGFGIPLIEAMKSGCPVIASKSSSVKEIANDAAVLIESISSDKIQNSIVRLKDISYRFEKIKKGIDTARNFSWDKMASETLDFYNCVRGEK